MTSRPQAQGALGFAARWGLRGLLVVGAGFLIGLLLASQGEDRPAAPVAASSAPLEPAPARPRAQIEPPPSPEGVQARAPVMGSDVDRTGRRLAALRPMARTARPKKPRGKRSDSLMALARRLRMPGGAMEDPCLRAVGTECVETALERFYRKLDAVERGEGRARIGVFGNSLIASDRIINIWRDRMVERFGDAGRGFLLTDRMAAYGGRSRTSARAWGLETFNVGQGDLGKWPHGMSGIVHVSTGKAAARWWTKGATRARVFWLDHKQAPVLKVRFDDGPITEVRPEGSGEGRIIDLEVPEGAKLLRMRASGRRAVLYGATLENEKTSGVIVDTMGVVASDSTRFLITDEGLFTGQLGALSPDLVTVMLGGNETKRVAWGKSSFDIVRRDLHRFLDRIQRTVPEASCLVVGPIENIRGKGKSRPWETRWQLLVVNRIMREVALQEGCAFFDLFKAMGGRGALRRLHERGLLHDDLVHPRGRGLDLPGELVAQALLAGYEASSLPPSEEAVRARWRDLTEGLIDESALAPLVSAALALRKGERKELKVALVGHDRISEPVLDALRERFGRGGRGWNPVDENAKRISLGDVGEALELEVLFAGKEAPRLRAGSRRLSPERIEAGSEGRQRAFYTLTRRRGLKLDEGTSELLAWRTHERYPGLVVDVFGPGGADPKLIEGDYDLVLGPSPGHDERRRSAWKHMREKMGPTACVRWSIGGAPEPLPPCQSLDVLGALGGAQVLDGEPLLDDQGPTERGVKVAVDVVVGALLSAFDRTDVARARVGW